MIRVFMVASLLLAGVACEQIEIFADTVQHSGTVYECSGDDGATLELCYREDAAEQLGEQLGRVCARSGRWWPVLTNAVGLGCRYVCPPPGAGCNALHGCYCD